MVFSSFFFIYLFLPATLLLYYCAPRCFRNYVLLSSSIIFYSWGAPTVLPLLFLSCSADYWISLFLRPRNQNKRLRYQLLCFAISGNLGLLFYYKFANFFVDQFNQMLGFCGLAPMVWHAIVLPMGISFFTFHKISYLVDVYRGEVEPTKSLFDYLLYILFFPQLIAGPIVRYHDVSEQLTNRTERWDLFNWGFIRFCIGLAKKVLIADILGMVTDTIFRISGHQLSSPIAWLGTICYSLQIYFDFSGYSDMAIGLAMLFGFRFAENFNAPYRAHSFTEFWRRWHISLSAWMREYLYIPLGGNRCSPSRMYFNLWVVFLLSGFWHGAQWTFLLWGCYHGVFLVFDRLIWGRISAGLPNLINMALTFLLVSLGWVLFRSDSIHQAMTFYSRLFLISQPEEALLLARAEIIHNRGIFTLLLALTFAFLPIPFLSTTTANLSHRSFILSAAALCLLILSSASLLANGFTPFLYFRF